MCLFDISDQLTDFGSLQVEIASKPRQKARTAGIILKAGQVTLPKPWDSMEENEPEKTTINFVEALELDVPKKVTQ